MTNSKKNTNKTRKAYTGKIIKVEDERYVQSGEGQTYRSQKEPLYYNVRRTKNSKGKYMTKVYQILNPTTATLYGKGRKHQKLKLAYSTKERSDKVTQGMKDGKILPKITKYYRQEAGKGVYEYFSTKAPRSTGKKIGGQNKGKPYKVQFVGYYAAQKQGSKRHITVMGFSSGQYPGSGLNREELKAEAYNRAYGEAGNVLKSTNFEMSLISGGYRYYGHK